MASALNLLPGACFLEEEDCCLEVAWQEQQDFLGTSWRQRKDGSTVVDVEEGMLFGSQPSKSARVCARWQLDWDSNSGDFVGDFIGMGRDLR